MSTYGIATGFNAANPTALHLLSGELFWRYEGGVDDQWFQAREVNGALTTTLTSKPKIVWRLVLSQSEWAYLKQNIYTTDTRELTIRSPNRGKYNSPWERYNVLGRWIDLNDGSGRYLDRGFWYDVELEFVVVAELGA